MLFSSQAALICRSQNLIGIDIFAIGVFYPVGHEFEYFFPKFFAGRALNGQEEYGLFMTMLFDTLQFVAITVGTLLIVVCKFY